MHHNNGGAPKGVRHVVDMQKGESVVLAEWPLCCSNVVRRWSRAGQVGNIRRAKEVRVEGNCNVFHNQVKTHFGASRTHQAYVYFMQATIQQSVLLAEVTGNSLLEQRTCIAIWATIFPFSETPSISDNFALLCKLADI